jgi:hypothetical protein
MHSRTYSGHGSAAATIPPPPSLPVATGFRDDEYSCGISEFLRRTGVGRTKLYQLLQNGEVESFRLDAKRLILLPSWVAYVARRQAAERGGEMRRHPSRRRPNPPPPPPNVEGP